MTLASQTEERTTSRFADALIDLLDRVQYRRVSVNEQHDPVYRLRYEAYRRESFVPISSQSTTRDEFDDVPNCYCFGVHIDGELVGSLRFHHVTPEMRYSPCLSVWPDVLNPLLDQGHSFIDPGRFTADYEATLAYPALPYLILRIAAMACVHFSVRYCMSGIRPEHAAFYRRVFEARMLGDERRYAKLAFPMVLYVADVPVIRERVFARFPFFMSTPQECEALFAPQGTPVPAIAPSARQAQRLALLARTG